MVDLQEIMERGAKKFGSGTYFKGSEGKMDFARIPSGIFALDYMLGGGFPIGVTSSVYGPPGGGKTLVMTRISAGVQNLCFRCYEYHWDCTCSNNTPLQLKPVIVQTEQFDMGWAIQLGLDPVGVTIAEADSGEQASDIIIECLRADDCGIVFLDSLPMLTPTVELEDSAMDQHVALQARLISAMIRRIKSTLIKEKKRAHPITFMATNQVRAKIGGFGFGPKEETPGGFASKHDWHATVRMSQLKSDNVDKTTELPIDAKFKGSMIAMGNKRKIFTLAGSCEFYVTVTDSGSYNRGTINDFKTVMRYGTEIGLITKDPWAFNGQEFATQTALYDDWLDSQKFLTAKKRIVDAYVARTKQVIAEANPDAQGMEDNNA